MKGEHKNREIGWNVFLFMAGFLIIAFVIVGIYYISQPSPSEALKVKWDDQNKFEVWCNQEARINYNFEAPYCFGHAQEKRCVCFNEVENKCIGWEDKGNSLICTKWKYDFNELRSLNSKNIMFWGK